MSQKIATIYEISFAAYSVKSYLGRNKDMYYEGGCCKWGRGIRSGAFLWYTNAAVPDARTDDRSVAAPDNPVGVTTILIQKETDFSET